MNSLLILQSELRGENEAQIVGERAKYLLEFHDLKLGIEVKALVWGGKIGTASVQELSPTLIRLKLTIGQEAPARPKLNLIVAVPRPQTLKKVLNLSAMAGATKVIFIKTNRVEKSYLQSKSLEAENIQYELIKGMEQVCDPIAPQVQKIWSLNELIERIAASGTEFGSLFVADPGAEPNLGDFATSIKSDQPGTLFIGPESGFEAEELARLKASKFNAVSIGPRILRVEFALAYLLGQLQLLQR